MKQEKLRIGQAVPYKNLVPGCVYKKQYFNGWVEPGYDTHIQFVKSYKDKDRGVVQAYFNYMGGLLYHKIERDGLICIAPHFNEVELFPILNWRKRGKLEMPEFKLMDKVLYSTGRWGWRLGFFECYVDELKFLSKTVGCGMAEYACIPFNKHTEHLLGKIGEPPYSLVHPDNRIFI